MFTIKAGLYIWHVFDDIWDMFLMFLSKHMFWLLTGGHNTITLRELTNTACQQQFVHFPYQFNHLL